MSTTWTKLKTLYLEQNQRKDLKRLDMYINSLKKIEKLLLIEAPSVIKNPFEMRRLGIPLILEKLEHRKGNALSGTEKAVVKSLHRLLLEIERL